jgi:hypothetical protein
MPALNTTVVEPSSDERGPDWAYRAAQALHASRAAKIDKQALRKLEKLAARAEKNATD